MLTQPLVPRLFICVFPNWLMNQLDFQPNLFFSNWSPIFPGHFIGYYCSQIIIYFNSQPEDHDDNFQTDINQFVAQYYSEFDDNIQVYLFISNSSSSNSNSESDPYNLDIRFILFQYLAFYISVFLYFPYLPHLIRHL